MRCIPASNKLGSDKAVVQFKYFSFLLSCSVHVLGLLYDFLKP